MTDNHSPTPRGRALKAIRGDIRRSLPPKVAEELNPFVPVLASEAILDDFARLAGLLGYVKGDDEQFEYGVQRPPHYGSTVAETRNHDEARSLAAAWGDETTVVRRRVIRGEWEAAADDH